MIIMGLTCPFLNKNLWCGCSLESPAQAILMRTHNIGFYEDLTKIIFQLSSNIINYAPYLLFCTIPEHFCNLGQLTMCEQTLTGSVWMKGLMFHLLHRITHLCTLGHLGVAKKSNIFMQQNFLYLSHVMIKSVFEVFDQIRHKPGCTTKEDP